MSQGESLRYLTVFYKSQDILWGLLGVMYHQTLGLAFLLDLEDMGFLNPSIPLKDIILDKSKIDRGKSKSKS